MRTMRMVHYDVRRSRRAAGHRIHVAGMRGIRRWHLSGDGNRYCRARIRGQKNGRIASSDMDIRIHVVGHGGGFGGLFAVQLSD